MPKLSDYMLVTHHTSFRPQSIHHHPARTIIPEHYLHKYIRPASAPSLPQTINHHLFQHHHLNQTTFTMSSNNSNSNTTTTTQSTSDKKESTCDKCSCDQTPANEGEKKSEESKPEEKSEEKSAWKPWPFGVLDRSPDDVGC